MNLLSINVSPLRGDLSFGSRITGVTQELLKEEALRKQLRDIFEQRGLIVFEDMAPSPELQVALSTVFGPLKEHPVPTVDHVDQDVMPGVIDMRHDPGTGTIVEIDGRQLACWLPWHFDHCYNNELNRAGVLRATEIPPEGGLTGFADGIDLYQSLSPALLQQVEGLKVIYTLDLHYAHMRFGQPRNFRLLQVDPGVYTTLAHARTLPRAIHPAVWTRNSGEKVLHVSPWMAVGIEGHEDSAGEALLESLCREILHKVRPYFHRWQSTDMVIWDNWRMLHGVSGHDPNYPRRMQRTTIKGDYGLGYFESGAAGDKLLEMTI